MRDIQKIRARLRDGEATSDDLTWAQQRLRVLREWPDDLTPEQTQEADWLASLIGQPA
jgi:hypothetical protein